MSFLNKKQDVLDIQLTKHGRELLSKGVFKPAYYAFFDKEIIYDSRTFSLIEQQNDTQDRILEETLTTQAQISFVGSKSYEQGYTNKEKFINNNFAGLPIGTSDGSVPYYPAWDIKVLNGKIKNFQLEPTSQIDKNIIEKNKLNEICGQYIPQINLEITSFDVFIEKTYDVNSIDPTKGEARVDLPIKDDNSFLKQVKNSVILSIEEKNVIDIGDNFDLELFYVDHENNEMQQLHFYKQAGSQNFSRIVDDILVDQRDSLVFEIGDDTFSENPELAKIVAQDDKNSNNYFEFMFDNEISLNELEIKRLDIYDRTIFDANLDCPPET